MRRTLLAALALVPSVQAQDPQDAPAVPKLEREDPELRAAEAQLHPIPEWALRRMPGGKRNLRAHGGSGVTENAVKAGLEWLARHQDEDGSWDCDRFMKHDPGDDQCDGAGNPRFDIGVTGLALLAFLGAGHTDAEGPYADNVRRGLDFLVVLQDEHGRIAGADASGAISEHAIATAALSEAYALTRSPRARDAATRAAGFLERARNPELAWRYARNGENDTAVTAWCTMALQSARLAGIKVDPEAFKGARAWVERVTDPDSGGVGYKERGGPSARPGTRAQRFPQARTRAMTAAGVLVRIVAGEEPRASEMVTKGSCVCGEILPTWNPDDGSIDMYYWYWGTLAMFQVGSVHWRKWNEAIVETVAGHQHQKGSGSRTGSWDPIGAWGEDGGRVYSTALMTMCLEVYYRYPRIFGVK